MNDRDQVVELVSRLGLLVDARDWGGLRELFCDEVDLDYTSLNGGEAQRLSPDDIVGAWRANLMPLAATQQLIANHLVKLDSDEAAVTTNVTATHVASEATGDPLWTVGDRYDLRVRRSEDQWRIAALTLTVRWATGNQAVMGGR